MKTMVYNRAQHLKQRRTFRKILTPAESRLWARLRNRQLSGVKFRRQFGVGPYSLDFYCPNLKLAIEVDGDTHAIWHAELHDHKRQAYLATFGIGLLRFANDEIYNHLEDVLETILEHVRQLIDEGVKHNPKVLRGIQGVSSPWQGEERGGVRVGNKGEAGVRVGDKGSQEGVKDGKKGSQRADACSVDVHARPKTSLVAEPPLPLPLAKGENCHSITKDPAIAWNE